MCTVSLIPATAERGLRLVVNRDERRTRPVAWPPVIVHVDGVAVAWPTDSHALGTWVAAASTGLAYALMNAIGPPGPMPRAGSVSRGRVIPSLAGAVDVDDVCIRIAGLPLTRYAPFRLVVAGHNEVALVAWDGDRPRVAREPLSMPRVYSSSGLGDAMVEQPRRLLFETLLAQERDSWRAQDRLHQHAWPDRRHLSVVMSRPGACTVSRTAVVMTVDRADMTYAPFLEGWPGPISTTSVAYRESRVAVLV